MATSQQDLVEEILSSMYAYTQQQPAMSTLNGPIGAADTTIPYDSTVNVPRGSIEIDDELLYVMQANTTNNTLLVPSWGRGYAGSTAAVHASGARMTVDPSFPRKRINDIINEVIGALDGDIYGVTSYEFTPTPAINTYTLPASTGGVLSAVQQTFGPSLEWSTLARYSVDLLADASLGTRSITFQQWLRPGRPVKLVLRTHLLPIVPGQLLSDANLQESHRDLVVLGSQIKLLLSQDFGRLQTTTVEAANREAVVPITSASTIAGRLNQIYQARILEEKFLLMGQYPTRLVRSN